MHLKIWQWISGGAEDFDKDILETAKREFGEETGIKDIKITEDVKKNVLSGIDEIFDFTKQLSQKVQELFDPEKEYRKEF